MDYDEKAKKRFWALVTKTDDCWIWDGTKNLKGYGLFWYTHNPNCPGNQINAHRMSFYLDQGRWPEPGMEVEHLCHNRKCVRPDHLREATRSENQLRRRENGTDSRGERNGSAKLTESQVIEIREKWATGDYLGRELADEYGVKNNTISQIVNNKKWKHV